MSEGGLSRKCKTVELEMGNIAIHVNRSAVKSICKMAEKEK